MGNARNLARVIVDSNGDIAAGNLDNAVPADGSITAAKLAASLDLSSKTLTYPDNSVQSADIVSLAASKLSGQVPDANAPSGSVIQVVSFTSTTTATKTGSTWDDMGDLALNITPSAASSKILILGSLHTEMLGSDLGYTRIDRNGTAIGNGGGSGHRVWLSQGYGGINGTNSSVQFLDSPATTSVLTYKFQWYVGGGTAYLNRGVTNTTFNDTSTITLLEIAG
jgi:hypothetical protein